MRVGLATWEELPALSADDQLLADKLERSGHAAVPAVWDDRSVDWSGFDVVVLRSTWNYYRSLERFLAWVDRVSAETSLWNRAGTVRWNSHKSYLFDLERAGVPIVPTRQVRDMTEARAVIREERWARAVLKPVVSAGGYRTHLVTDASLSEDSPVGRDVQGVPELLVQPYQENVERGGERSLVFFQGTYSHAFLRAPHLARSSTLVEGSPVIPSAAELRVAERAVAAVVERTLYARVDLVSDDGGRARLMELELIEPFLGLASSGAAAQTLADAIATLR